MYKRQEEQITSIVVRVWDIAGNVSEEKARDIVLDKTPPTASYTLTPGKDGKVNINLGTDGSICGVQSITRPDGSVVYGRDTLVFEVDQNGDYDFFVWDRCGNLLKYTVPVSYTHLDVYKRQGGNAAHLGCHRKLGEGDGAGR